MYKILGVLSIGGTLLSVVSCSGGNYKKATIATVMCNPDLQRFQKASLETQRMIKKLGYNADFTLKSAQKDENSWTEAAISKGAKAIIMAPSDSNAASTIVNKAYKNHIPFVDYDKLITGTNKYNYYTTFNNAKTGKLEAYGVALQVFGMNVNSDGIIVNDDATGTLMSNSKINIMTATDIDIINLVKSKKIPGKDYYIGWLAGSDTDNNAQVIYNAQKSFMNKLYGLGIKKAWDKIDFSSISVPLWSQSKAKDKVEAMLKDDMKDKINGIVCANDSTAQGAVQAIKNKLNTNWDARKANIFISGQDATDASINSIKNGGQSFTVSKPDTILAPIAVLIADNLIKHPEIQIKDLLKNIQSYIKKNNLKINFTIDTKSYKSTKDHNVNTFLITPKPVTRLTLKAKDFY